MKTTFKDTSEAPNKWWAARDAQMRNAANKTRWSPGQQLKAQRMTVVLESVYSGRVYTVYGKRKLSVKVDKPVVVDRKNLREMETYWTQQGITKTLTPQGIMYQIV